jgi:hypothetical protein
MSFTDHGPEESGTDPLAPIFRKDEEIFEK